jgi:hypothetical protein
MIGLCACIITNLRAGVRPACRPPAGQAGSGGSWAGGKKINLYCIQFSKANKPSLTLFRIFTMKCKEVRANQVNGKNLESSSDRDITYGRRRFRNRQFIFSKTFNV